MYGPTSSKRPRLEQDFNRPPPSYHRSQQQPQQQHQSQAVIPPPPHPPTLQQQHHHPAQHAPPQNHKQPHHHNNQHRSDHSRHLAQIVETVNLPPFAENFSKMISQRMNNRYSKDFRYPYIHDIDTYKKITKIGQGTFGEVFQARCQKSSRIVALKKILMDNEREGFPITAIREVKMLQRLKHEHITELIEICNTKGQSSRDKSNFYLVFTFCDFDLAGLLSHNNVKLKLEDVKILMKHLLNGLFKIHKSNILHRDMKAANILVTGDGILKLADFGLSRPILKSSSKQNYTNRVVTLWYRPPELLLGSRKYGPQIDIWGAGCIMAELWTRTPIMQGDSEQKQLEIIQNVCGGISPRVWPGCEELPYYKRMELRPNAQRTLRDKMNKFVTDNYALNLLDALLTLDPSRRLDAERALDDDFFYMEPRPKSTNIKHILKELPKNIFEFTAGRGAHANRRPQNHTMHNGNQAGNPGHRLNRHVNRAAADGQLTDIVF